MELGFADRVWEVAREKFYDEVLANEKQMIIVPEISLANHFDSYNLFVKEKTVCYNQSLSTLYEVVINQTLRA